MKTTFSEMHLFNDYSQRQDTSFILNGKEWGVSRIEREGVRERKRKMWCIGEKGLWCGS